jgi:23S rRNA (cytosine1962-C5)-methyltransferase
VVFFENGLRFESDPVRGQKTGFFLDQRENRLEVRKLAAGKSVLNLFSFSGGFSLAAAAGGASRVVSLDISEHALAAAQRNFALNRGNAAVADCRHDIIRADAFAWLERKPDSAFDLVVLDPPSLAPRESHRAAALSGYRKLIAGALRRVRPGGMLLACSCSAHVSKEEFLAAAQETVRQSGRAFRLVQTTGQPPDHAARFPEGEYLKAIYLSV